MLQFISFFKSPLEQFEILPLIFLPFGYFDFSITNQSIMLFLILMFFPILFFHTSGLQNYIYSVATMFVASTSGSGDCK